MTLSALIGMVVFVLIMIPIIIAALEALNLTALTAPLVAMLTAVMVAIPVLIVAVLVIIVAYFVGRVVGDFVAQFLAGLGFDNILVRLGLAKTGPDGQAHAQPGGGLAGHGRHHPGRGLECVHDAAARSAGAAAERLHRLCGADHRRPVDLWRGAVARHLGLQLRASSPTGRTSICWRWWRASPSSC